MYSKNIYENIKEEKINEINTFAEGYKEFLSKCKTERLATKEAIRLAKEKGFVNLTSKKTLVAGDKVYVVNKDKNVMLFIIGNKPLTDGIRILGAHIDSPRLDIKQNPLY